MARLEFWYEFASSYSYLSVMRIEDLAGSYGVEVEWCPFLLGPIFQAQGWTTSPFNLYPAKGRYMVRDIERRAAERGLHFELPTRFPANGLQAARLALVGKPKGWIAEFTKKVFVAEFGRGEDISSLPVLTKALTGLGIDAEDAFALSREPEQKEAMRHQTTSAQEKQIFGAPSFVTPDGELFWGDDRLEQAIAWTKRTASIPST